MFSDTRRPTDTDKTQLIFCPAEQFGGDDFLQFGACCTDIEEGVVETKFLEAGALTTECAVLYKEVCCTYDIICTACISGLSKPTNLFVRVFKTTACLRLIAFLFLSKGEQ